MLFHILFILFILYGFISRFWSLMIDRNRGLYEHVVIIGGLISITSNFFSVIGQSFPKKIEKENWKKKRSELMLIEHIDPQIPSEKYKLKNSNQTVWIVIFMRWYHFTWVKDHNPMQCPRGSHFHLEKNIIDRLNWIYFCWNWKLKLKIL